MNNKIMKLKTLCFSILTILVWISATYAADTSQVIPFSGSIAGQPDGNVALRLRLFPAATGGVFVFQETQMVSVSGEAFSLLIGNGSPAGIPSPVFLNPSLWIAFALEAMPEAEIGDRTPITAAGYAFKAINANAAQTAASAQTAESATRATSAQTAETLNPGASITGSVSGPILRIVNTARTGPGGEADQDGKEAGPLSIQGIQVNVSGGPCSSASVVGDNGGCGVGVRGTSVSGYGVAGFSQTGDGVSGIANAASKSGVFGRNDNANNFGGVFGYSVNGRGVRGDSTNSDGVFGLSQNGWGVRGDSTNADGVQGLSSAAGRSGVGGRNDNGQGVFGYSLNGWGVWGRTAGDGSKAGVYGLADAVNGKGVAGEANLGVQAVAIYGRSTQGFAGVFDGRVLVNGTMAAKVVEITGADFSERFEVRGAKVRIEPGMVVAIDPEHPGQLVLSTTAYNRRVAGILSGAGGINTGMLMGQPGTLADGNRPVALSGRVYVWADASNGPIAPGDLLTTSTVAGHAMKVTNYIKAQGAILGKAMTGLKEGKGLVLVLVTLQ